MGARAIALAALWLTACGPKDVATGRSGFRVFGTQLEQGGWVIHHHDDRGDTLWGCPPLADAERCAQILFDAWRPGASVDILSLDPADQSSWVRLRVAGDMDRVFYCVDPTGDPSCRLMELELYPPAGKLERVWPGLHGVDAEGAVLPEDDPRRWYRQPGTDALVLQAGSERLGPSNLYSCQAPQGEQPACTLAVPNWLVFDRQGLGFRKLENVEQKLPTGELFIEPGARIALVSDGSVADRAGLQEGDVIVRIGAFEVRDAGHAQALLAQYPSGHPIELGLKVEGSPGAERILTLTPERKPTAD